MLRDEINLRDQWRILLRRRWTIYLAVASVTLVALFASFAMTPLYRATATLQIERRNPDILTFRDLSQVDYSWAAYNDFYQTQYKLIGGAPVARNAADRLGLASHPDFDTGKRRPGLLMRLRSLVPRNRPAVETDPRDRLAQRILAGLDVSPIRNSHLVTIAWTSDNPELAAMVANSVADSYVQLNIESQYSTSGQAEEFLVDQIANLKREITEIESKLQDYGESKRIVSIDDTENLTLQALKEISAKHTEAQTTLARAEAAYHAVRSAAPEALPEVMNSPLISRLREEYAGLEAQVSEQSERFGEDWPVLQTLTTKLRQAERRLAIETELISQQVRAGAEADYDRARNEVQNLEALLDAQESAAQRLKRDAVEFANLQSEVNKKRETLNALISRQNEVSLSTRLKDLDATSGNIRIIERAKVPVAPFRPNPLLNVILGLGFGIGLGVALAIMLDHLDNTINSVDELRELVSLPVLATIPRHGAGGSPLGRVRRTRPATLSATLDLVAHRDSKAGVAEAYRDLRTSILLSNPGQPPRTILVTSAVPEEGKTATSINLAVVLAQLGARVVMVDTDLRRPRLHHALEVRNDRGVSNYLSGLEPDPARLAAPTGIDNLDLVPSGPIPPNPSELLNSPTFGRFARILLDGGYDHVVFDSPPVLSVSDSVIIANLVDTRVLVVRAGRTAKHSVRLAVDKLRQAGDRPLGLVLNDVDPGTDGSTHYGYRYYGREDRRPTSPGVAAREHASGADVG
ncbi:MAG TPA: polysaccharide biosynthesis tyrosine autokinase [Candidatus Polarisedimenticolaceae bacterium]|nr:polysaccharide biosynthesis tyrosine autokinase [Candidatus Polarisedimenticolaceae bacterium]